MGLSRRSTGMGAAGTELVIQKHDPGDRVVALCGNPNVGKSTIFNALTGLHQHTGNWPGKTVTNAQGYCRRGEKGYILVDLPGCYSLQAHSAEEEAARDFLCFGTEGAAADCAVVVCDAACLERNLNLVLQVLELQPNTVVCVNLMDEAQRHGVHVDTVKLSQILGVPVVGASARDGKGLDGLMAEVERLCASPIRKLDPPPVSYGTMAEVLIGRLMPAAQCMAQGRLPARWLAVRLLDGVDETLKASLRRKLGFDPAAEPEVRGILSASYNSGSLRDAMAASVVHRAELLSKAVTTLSGQSDPNLRDRKIDRLLTSPLTGFPIMLLMLLGIFWLTISGANYPSRLLSSGLFWLGDRLRGLLTSIGAHEALTGLICDGMYRTLAWVVSVMLPPMAIFFPLFTLLEDLGYLPRVAFNLDRCFQSCGACGKQALTTCMGYTILHAA